MSISDEFVIHNLRQGNIYVDFISFVTGHEVPQGVLPGLHAPDQGEGFAIGDPNLKAVEDGTYQDVGYLVAPKNPPEDQTLVLAGTFRVRSSCPAPAPRQVAPGAGPIEVCEVVPLPAPPTLALLALGLLVLGLRLPNRTRG